MSLPQKGRKKKAQNDDDNTFANLLPFSSMP
jgi:hypothetical protein